MNHPILDNNLLGRLLDVGYMSVNVGLIDEADLILRNLSRLRGDRVEAALGLALLTWRTEGTEAALMALDQINERHPENPAALAFTAMVLAASDRTDDAIDVARKLIGSSDPQTRAYARNLLRDLSAVRSGVPA